jgi:hypothetical protein
VKTHQSVYHDAERKETSRAQLCESKTDSHVNMIVFTRLACFSDDVTASRDWLAGVPFKLIDAVDVTSEGDLMQRCLDWERDCFSPGAK